MSGITNSIKWLTIFVFFMWGCLVIFSCQVNNYQEEISSFKEYSRYLQILATKVNKQSETNKIYIENTEKKLILIENYLELGCYNEKTEPVIKSKRDK